MERAGLVAERVSLRLAFGRVAQETNAFSPVLTTVRDFETTHYLEGDALLAACRPSRHEVVNFVKNAELSGFVQALQADPFVELVATLSAWAVPGGPLSRACFEAVVGSLCARLATAHAEAPLHGVYLSLHGAMNVLGLALAGQETPESEIVRRVRAVVGEQVPIAISLDLHGQVVAGLVDRCQIIQGYRTNPHRDHRRIGAQCARQLVATARGQLAPVLAWRTLPMILGGSPTLDFWRPMRAIFRAVARAFEQPGMLGATVMTCHPWNAHPELGWATIAMADATPRGTETASEAHRAAVRRAEACAEALADMCWDARAHQPPRFLSATQAIAKARAGWLARKLGVVVMADTSDVVSAGAPGENTLLLRELLAAKELISYVPLRDPEVIAAHWPHVAEGDPIAVIVGRKLDPSRGAAFELTGVVHRKRVSHGVGRIMVIASGKTHVVIVEGPALAIRPLFYKEAGLRPLAADVIVVKNFFPFLMFFAPIMRKVLFVRTSGTTDFELAAETTFAGPVYPKDALDDWRGEDRRRRHGLTV